MQEIINQLVVTGQGMLRYRWHALLFAWLLAVLGWIGVMILPDNYEARAKVYVDTDTVLRPLLKGYLAENDVITEVTMISRALLAQPQLEKVARDTDLYLRAKTPKDTERLIDGLRERINIELLPQSPNLYSIRYIDNDRAMAERVVQKLLDSFVEDTLGVKRQDTTSAQRFLEQQISDYESRLRGAEERLAAFKKENVGKMPGEEGDYYARLQAAMAKVEIQRQEYRIAQERRDELARQIEGEEPTFGLMNQMAESSTPLAGQIADLHKQLENLLLQYTEKHPRVIAVQETITRLEEKRAEEKQHGMPSAKTSELAALNALDQNPVYQRMKIQLKDAEVALTEARSKVRETEGEISRLRSSVNTIPEVEAQLARLNRDYEVNRTQHAALLKSLETARLSEDVEQSRDDVRFRIIEPPVAPLRPASPNRPVFIVVVLLGALGAGAGLAFLLHQVNPVFATRHALREALGLPVLGSISFALGTAQLALERRGNLRLGFAGGLLLAAFVLMLVGAQFAPGWLQGIIKG